MLSKSLLEWPKEASPETGFRRRSYKRGHREARQSLNTQAWALNEPDTFEARWRERVKMQSGVAAKGTSRSKEISPTRHRQSVLVTRDECLLF